MRVLICIFLLLGSFNTFARKKGRIRPKRCFSKHLKEAWQLNKLRKPLYSKLSQKKSRVISNRLIWSEKLIYRSARKFEKKLFRRDKKLEALMCQIFISMDEVPPFMTSYLGPAPQKTDFIEFAAADFQKDLQQKFKAEEFDEIDRDLEHALAQLKGSLKTNCMFRHVIESTLRSLRLLQAYPFNNQKDRKLGMSLISQHLRALKSSYSLDLKALDTQVLGVPVICYDVPEIPVDV